MFIVYCFGIKTAGMETGAKKYSKDKARTRRALDARIAGMVQNALRKAVLLFFTQRNQAF